MNENNQDNFLSSEDKISISPISSDMVELSEQRAAEFAKPYESPVSEEALAPMKEVKDEMQQPQMQGASQAVNIEPTPVISEPIQHQVATDVYPTPTAPTFGDKPQEKEQEIQYVEIPENKSDRLKEKLSIAFGFGVLPLGVAIIALSVYLFYLSIAVMFGGASPSAAETKNLQNIAQIAYWIIYVGIIAMPIAGVILGSKYEKATGKISVGKILSIVSGIAVAIIVSISIFGYIQQQAQKADIKNKSQQHSTPSTSNGSKNSDTGSFQWIPADSSNSSSSSNSSKSTNDLEDF